MRIIKDGIKRIPGAKRITRNTRRGANDLVCAAIQRAISTRHGHDILVLLGMRRSGNHLAINWILGQTQGAAVFYNNIRASAHPFTATRKEYRIHLPNTRPRIILSYEDMTPDDLASGPLPDFLTQRMQGQGAKVQFGLILRDPFNLFASRLQKWPERFASEAEIENQKALYICHARLATTPVPVFGCNPLIPILYNHLVSDETYRKGLAAKLGISNGTKGMETVPVYGHGSSFDGYDTDATRVQSGIFERWHSVRSDSRFLSVSDDPDIPGYASTLFGMETNG
jgi:hypothetical protein